MAGIPISGADIAKRIREEVKADVARAEGAGVVPKMAAVITSDDPAALSYAQSKVRLAGKLGIELQIVEMDHPGQDALEETLKGLSEDPGVHGIMLELPLAGGLDLDRALDRIDPLKDVDGLTARNLGMLFDGREDETIVPATPQACILLAETVGPLSGRQVAVIGKGRTVGKPLIALLLNRRATPVICHSKTRDTAAAIKDSEVVFVAVGKAGLLRADMVHAGQTLIDAGINVVDGKIVGDVAPEAQEAAAAFTPVPDGVGPVTTALIFKNLMKAIRLQGRL